MMEKFKTAMLSIFLSAGIMATLASLQVQAAGKNGDGIVYHRSDCSPGFVRMYGGGGDWSGSACGKWLSPLAIKTVWNADHNWRIDEIDDCATYVRDYLTVGTPTVGLCARRD